MALVDVFVLCSRAEGLPYVLLEAMQAGIPVVASDVPGIADLIDDGRTGLLYPWGDLDRLADHLTRCLQNADLRRHLARQAQQHVASHHLLDVQVERMLRLYSQLAQPLEVTADRPADGRAQPSAVLVEEP
jgi:glycosyltransferase involved in cell wall biosynthesis